ncbi:MAG: MATE family efflux transporter [Bacteroidetes bacterium]|nr:MATE family efflux transporter [Bacteroidota bacterium]
MLKTFFKNPHTKSTVHLAFPLIITQVGHIVTGMVDTIFLGQIGSSEQAAGILSNNLYMLLLVFCIGISYATTPLVTAAHEENNLLKKASLFKNSLLLNVLVACVCFLVLFLASDLLNYMRQPPEVVELAIPFFNVIVFSIIPTSLFFVCKQYCEGLSNTRIALVISIASNVINVILNYALIYGKLGLPELGYMGSAWASFVARCFLGIAFLIIIFKSSFTKEIAEVYKRVKINWQDLKDLARIGFNSAMQFTFEVAAFAIAGFMSGSFGKEQIDAHGIALGLAAFTYMFGSGIGSASTIRAGIFKAQNNWQEIKNSASVSVKLIVLVMGAFGILFLLLHKLLPLGFSSEKEIVELASQLLLIAAMFQLFDGLQVTVIGILRGLEDVKIPTVITLIGYWIIALPLAYFMAFTMKMETIGIWIALLTSLVFVSLCLLWRLNYLIKKNLT